MEDAKYGEVECPEWWGDTAETDGVGGAHCFIV